MPVEPEDLRAVDGIGDETIAHLIHRYGHAAGDVLALAQERAELRERIVPDLPDLLAEVVIAARAEQAQSVGDVMLRRTRLGLLAAPAVCGGDSDAARAVARLLAEQLGWDDARVDTELAAWRDEAIAEGIVAEGAAAP
jgi:glycerol-3-phosphate dehydrogenase